MRPAAALARLPAVATTGVGSLPFRDPGEAVAHVAAAYDLPFCPQLPARDGDMLAEWLGADPGRCGWSPERERTRPAAWGAFLAAMAARPPAHGVVKLQATGPLTLAHGLGARRDDPDLAGLALDLARWAAATVAGWVAEVSDLGLVAVVMVDEPGIGDVGDPGLAGAWDPLRAVSPLFGLHVCGDVPWPLVLAARPDVVSFDVSRWRPGSAGAPALAGLAALGIVPAPGIVPVVGGAVPRPVPAQGAERLLLTPACGTGLATVARERALAAALRRIAREASRRLAVPVARG